MICYEDDRPVRIPEEYLKMTPEELDRESERVYQEYRKKHPRPTKTVNSTSPIKFFMS